MNMSINQKDLKKKRRKESEYNSKVLSPKMSEVGTNNVSPAPNNSTEIVVKKENESLTPQKIMSPLLENNEINGNFPMNNLALEENDNDVNDVPVTQAENNSFVTKIDDNHTSKLNEFRLEEDQEKDMIALSENESNKQKVKSMFKVDSSMKVAELKKLLRERGLKVSGKKSELLRRLRSPKPSDKSRQSEIPKMMKVNVPEQRKENISPKFIIYTENDTERNVRPVRKSQRNPLQRRDLNELESSTNEMNGVKKHRKPLLQRTRPSEIVEKGAERRRNLAQTLKASLRETELLL